MSDKVYGGTPSGTASLCLTCRQAHSLRGLNLQEVVRCCALNPVAIITFPVEKCSLYDDKRLPPLGEMREIAWIVTSRNRGPVGFTDNRASEIHIEPPNRYEYPVQPGKGELK